MEEQAGSTQPVVLVELAGRTRANGEGANKQIERLPDRVRVRERPEVAPALPLAPTGNHCARPLLVLTHGEERIALVVPETNVEPRSVLLDQRVLEHQRLDLVANLDPLHRLGGSHHLGRARVQVARVLEIVGQTTPQRRRLADVDHPALRVLELVRAGGLRDRPCRRSLNHCRCSTACGRRGCRRETGPCGWPGSRRSARACPHPRSCRRPNPPRDRGR
ncbi:unannotated protein [freshwater metagenome]|uniref:Unannotated protein n=1 Tax=freshwater metagenome TaxID=449393 RepID=A0A6J7UPM7_9ZZZZ